MQPRSPITVALIEFAVTHCQRFIVFGDARKRNGRNHIPAQVFVEFGVVGFGNLIFKLLGFGK
jgi:hypothetical protein